MDVTAAVACPECAWFGVYRTDVAAQLAGCPNCGSETLEQRDLEDPTWQEFGAELLHEAPAANASFRASR
jgi:predicted  nucleic acid-binding Zn-ribbon protein